jgi:hypothetical protein
MLLYRDIRKESFTRILSGKMWFAAAVCLWAVLAMGMLCDLQLGHRLYFPFVAYDLAFRSDVTAAIAKAGVPPPNPFFFPGKYYGFRYHYFWYILSGLVMKSAPGLGARQAILASIVWCGTGLMAIVSLYVRFFQTLRERAVIPRAAIGIGLLWVTGLDILPVVRREMRTGQIQGSLEWWNEQVAAWIGTALWVPHHLASLVACMAGFLVLWHVKDRGWDRVTAATVVAAAAMWAGGFGLSIYVAFAFGVAVLTWMAVAMLRNERSHAAMLLASGAISLGFALPMLLELAGKAGRGAVAASDAASAGLSQFPLGLWVRPFPMLMVRFGIYSPYSLKAAVANLLFLPVNYAVELGFFLMAGLVFAWRVCRKGNAESAHVCAIAMATAGTLVCTFIRSTAGQNDLGTRGFLIAQFLLLLIAVDLLWSGGWRAGGIRYVLIPAMFVGCAGTVYDLYKIRFLTMTDIRTIASPSEWLPLQGDLGSRTFAMRSIYAELAKQMPERAVYQHNPKMIPQDSLHGLYADRQVAAETPSCSVIFGGSKAECDERIGPIRAFFDDAKYDPAKVESACRALSIDVLVVQDTDAVWKDKSSWVWVKKPIMANDFARVFACGKDVAAK